MKFTTADLFDDYADELQVCEPIFLDFGGNTDFCGTIRTLKIFESFAVTKSTLATDGEGHILVIDAGGSLRCAMLGDKLGAALPILHVPVSRARVNSAFRCGLPALHFTRGISFMPMPMVW